MHDNFDKRSRECTSLEFVKLKEESGSGKRSSIGARIVPRGRDPY